MYLFLEEQYNDVFLPSTWVSITEYVIQITKTFGGGGGGSCSACNSTGNCRCVNGFLPGFFFTMWCLAITHHPFRLGSPNFEQRRNALWLIKIHIVLEDDWSFLHGQIHSKLKGQIEWMSGLNTIFVTHSNYFKRDLRGGARPFEGGGGTHLQLYVCLCVCVCGGGGGPWVF